MMPTRTQLAIFLAVVVILWGIGLHIDGVSLTKEMILPFSFVLGAAYIVLQLFEHFLWKLGIWYPWCVKMPNLNGTWRATLHSTWINPETGEGVPPIPAFLVIKQNYSDMHIRLLTPESSSETRIAKVAPSNDGTFEVVCVYLNAPKQAVRSRSEIHFGGMRITIGERYPARMEAHYWTDRGTTGDIELEDRKNKRFADHQSAIQAFAE